MPQVLNIEQKLADFLSTQNFHPEMKGANGLPAQADQAKTFSFDYTASSGKNYGTMVIILGDDNEMYIMYGDNLGKTIEDPEDRQEFYSFQQQLSDLANRNRWTATMTDISKLKQVQAGIAAIKEGLFEGYYGTRRISYAGEPTEARLMIKHNRTLGENDARFRYVESVFVETVDGERFKLPFTHMGGARAMLEHVRQGGKPYDVRGNHIVEMVSELKVLNRFNRAAAGRVMEGVTQQIVEQAQAYYKQLKESLKHLGSSRGYRTYFETWHPLDVQEQQSLVEDIKTMFIEQTLDTRIEAALPLLARIQQQGKTMKEAEIFESWANRLVEGTWSLPETPEQMAKLKTLMSKELIVGPDATNATEQLYDLVGDDQLYDQLSDIANDNPAADVRWAVIDRLREMGFDVGELEALEGGNNQAPEQSVTESRILDESGETFEHILDRFKFEVRQFEQTGELDDDLYEALFDYYFNAGEMPYGTAKARTGDPYEWIGDRLSKDLGMNEADAMQTFEGDTEDAIAAFLARGGTVQQGKYHRPRKSEKTDYGSKHIGTLGGAGKPSKMSGTAANVGKVGKPVVTAEASACNHTMEGEYCPEHGLMECGTMESMGGTVAGAVAPVVGEGNDDPMNYNAAITGSYYESVDPLARIKELALRK